MAAVRQERASRDGPGVDGEFPLQHHAHAVAGIVRAARVGEGEAGNPFD